MLNFASSNRNKMNLKTNHTIINGDSRQMPELKDKSVDLIITSPPYWQLKDYGTKNQIGFNDSYEDYINNLNLVWNECYRVLNNGCRLCVNIGDTVLDPFLGSGTTSLAARNFIKNAA